MSESLVKMHQVVLSLQELIDNYSAIKSNGDDWQVDFNSEYENINFHIYKFNEYADLLKYSIKEGNRVEIKKNLRLLRSSSVYILGFFENLFEDLDVIEIN